MNDNVKIPHCEKCQHNNNGICNIYNTKIVRVFWCPQYIEVNNGEK